MSPGKWSIRLALERLARALLWGGRMTTSELIDALELELEAVMWLRSEVRVLRRLAPARAPAWWFAAVGVLSGVGAGVWAALVS